MIDIDAFSQKIKRLYIDIEAETPIAVAVSGGPDSMALLWLLVNLPPQESFRTLYALTVDHGLRPDSAAEARQVGEWVASWSGVTHTVLTRTAPESGHKIMEEARRDRYRMMESFCRGKAVTHLFVAHHRDDQAETLLFRLAKGSGLDGLGGMKPVRRMGDVDLCRPLLDVAKEDLTALCRARNIPFVNDPSNINAAYARPRLRAAMDVLAAEGLTAERMAKTALRLARASDALKSYADTAWETAILKINTNRIDFSFSVLNNLPSEIRFRLILKACKTIRNDEASTDNHDYGPRIAKLEDLIDRFFLSDTYHHGTLGGCLFTLNRKAGTLSIEREGLSPPL